MNVLGMCRFKHLHDKLSCTRSQNYTIGTFLLGIRIRIPKSNIPILSVLWTTSCFMQWQPIILQQPRCSVIHRLTSSLRAIGNRLHPPLDDDRHQGWTIPLRGVVCDTPLPCDMIASSRNGAYCVCVQTVVIKREDPSLAYWMV